MEEVCKNCKHIVPHVHEYIDGEWKYIAECVKKTVGGRLFTIPDRNTFTCEKFEKSTNVFPEYADI